MSNTNEGPTDIPVAMPVQQSDYVQGTQTYGTQEAAARIAELEAALRSVGANRYWEGRWRDEAARIAELEDERDRFQEALAEANKRIASLESLTDSAEVDTVIFVRDREAAAVLAEREECRKIAHRYRESQIAQSIENAIRARPAP